MRDETQCCTSKLISDSDAPRLGVERPGLCLLTRTVATLERTWRLGRSTNLVPT